MLAWKILSQIVLINFKRMIHPWFFFNQKSRNSRRFMGQGDVLGVTQSSDSACCRNGMLFSLLCSVQFSFLRFCCCSSYIGLSLLVGMARSNLARCHHDTWISESHGIWSVPVVGLVVFQRRYCWWLLHNGRAQNWINSGHHWHSCRVRVVSKK